MCTGDINVLAVKIPCLKGHVAVCDTGLVSVGTFEDGRLGGQSRRRHSASAEALRQNGNEAAGGSFSDLPPQVAVSGNGRLLLTLQ